VVGEGFDLGNGEEIGHTSDTITDFVGVSFVMGSVNLGSGD